MYRRLEIILFRLRSDGQWLRPFPRNNAETEV